jgi:hypothetical protein
MLQMGFLVGDFAEGELCFSDLQVQSIPRTTTGNPSQKEGTRTSTAILPPVDVLTESLHLVGEIAGKRQISKRLVFLDLVPPLHALFSHNATRTQDQVKLNRRVWKSGDREAPIQVFNPALAHTVTRSCMLRFSSSLATLSILYTAIRMLHMLSGGECRLLVSVRLQTSLRSM